MHRVWAVCAAIGGALLFMLLRDPISNYIGTWHFASLETETGIEATADVVSAVIFIGGGLMLSRALWQSRR